MAVLVAAGATALPFLAGATEDVNNFGDTRGGALAGPLALVIIVLLSIATVLLIRNMNKRLRRLPASFADHHVDRPGDDPEKPGVDRSANP
jgi:hypothetical protein